MKTKPMVLGAVALLLTGCTTAAPEATPTPTPTPVSANLQACEDFAALTLEIPEKVNDNTGNANDMWESVRVEFDEVALTAEGAVQDRMLALVNDWPGLAEILVWHDFDGINAKIEAVERACKADDAPIDAGKLTT